MTPHPFLQDHFTSLIRRGIVAIELGATLAQRIVTQLISDLSGEEIPDGHGETIEFAYRGIAYSIDLTAKEVATFDRAVAPQLEHATVVAGTRKSAAGRGKQAASRPRADLRSIRVWARENGYEVSDRGRVRAEVQQAYDAAH